MWYLWTYHLMVVAGIAMRCIKVFSILYGYFSMHWNDKQWTATGLSCTHYHIPFRIFLFKESLILILQHNKVFFIYCKGFLSLYPLSCPPNIKKLNHFNCFSDLKTYIWCGHICKAWTIKLQEAYTHSFQVSCSCSLNLPISAMTNCFYPQQREICFLWKVFSWDLYKL
jgi:hypothetical protein